MWCREHAEGSLLWDVFYVPDVGSQPAAQMCMESAAQQATFSLQLASQLDQEDRLTIKTLTFLFRCSLIPGFHSSCRLGPSLYHVLRCISDMHLKLYQSYASVRLSVCHGGLSVSPVSAYEEAWHAAATGRQRCKVAQTL